jgi:hypothetical protein
MLVGSFDGIPGRLRNDSLLVRPYESRYRRVCVFVTICVPSPSVWVRSASSITEYGAFIVDCGPEPVVITILPDVDPCARAGIADKKMEVPNRILAFVQVIGIPLLAGSITESLINRHNTRRCDSLQ